MTAPGEIRQADDAAVESPGKRLTSAGANRPAHRNSAVRHTEPLGRIVAGINDADVINLIGGVVASAPAIAMKDSSAAILKFHPIVNFIDLLLTTNRPARQLPIVVIPVFARGYATFRQTASYGRIGSQLMNSIFVGAREL